MRLPRVQFTVRWMMILIVFVALVAAFVGERIRAVRREREMAVRIERLLAEYRRAIDRAQWAERMRAKGYASQAQLEAENASLKKAESSLGIQD